MKLGLVLECDIGGPDELVLKCFARRLRPGIEVLPVAQGDKRQLFSNGAVVAKDLVEIDGCDLVLIVWDLKPPFEGPPLARNCEDESTFMANKLQMVPRRTREKIRLLCLTWEIETWLLADAAAVRAHLSTGAHQSTFKCNKPLAKSDAKATLDRACKAYRRSSRGYTDVTDAILIACKITRTNKLRRVPSFARFSELIAGSKTADFRETAAVCADLVHAAHMFGR